MARQVEAARTVPEGFRILGAADQRGHLSRPAGSRRRNWRSSFESESVEDRARRGRGQHLVQRRAGGGVGGRRRRGARRGPPRARASNAASTRCSTARSRSRLSATSRRRRKLIDEAKRLPLASSERCADRLPAGGRHGQDAPRRSRGPRRAAAADRRRQRQRRSLHDRPSSTSSSATPTSPRSSSSRSSIAARRRSPRPGRGAAVLRPRAGEAGKGRREPEGVRAVLRDRGRTPTPACRSWPPRGRNTPRSAASCPDSEGTAENAEIAEPDLLCGLCALGGFFRTWRTTANGRARGSATPPRRDPCESRRSGRIR